MTRFVLVPGADGQAWYWHRLIPELHRRGHVGVAVELPKAKTATLAAYAEAIVLAATVSDPAATVSDPAAADSDPAAAISASTVRASGSSVVLVAQSLGAFSAPLACSRLDVEQLVLVNPMVPTPAETGNDWWANTGHAAARAAAAAANGWPAEFDLQTGFFHDVPPDITEQALAANVRTADLDTVFAEPWPLPGWPDVPTRFLQGRDDRFFPVDFQRRIAGGRLGLRDIETVPGGHLVALSRPVELAAALIGQG